MTEAEIMRDIQLEATKLGHRLWRNNVGTAKTHDGRWIKFGLCVGSSDLIGLTKDGRFLAVEVKGPKGKPTKEQTAFVEQINSMGGIGFVANSVESFKCKIANSTKG